MGTRCQVKMEMEGMTWNHAVTLYHHWDGYPTNILKLLQQARKSVPDKDAWQAGRAGKAASYVCAVEPGEFEPEEGHEKHGDIEWYYVVHCVNEKQGCTAENPKWLVDVYDEFHDEKVADRKNLMELSDTDMWDIEHWNDSEDESE